MKNALATKDQTKTLATLVAEAQGIIQALVEAGGELTPELEARLEVNQTSLVAKVDGYAFIESRLEAEAEFWKRRAEVNARIAKTLTNMQKNLLERIKWGIQEMGKTEVCGVDSRFFLVKCAQKLVINPDVLPPEWTMQVTETVPDKERIKAALTDGFEVPGASLEGGLALRVGENKGE